MKSLGMSLIVVALIGAAFGAQALDLPSQQGWATLAILTLLFVLLWLLLGEDE